MAATRIDTRTGNEERFDYFGSAPDFKFGRLLSPAGAAHSAVLIAASIDADEGLAEPARGVSRLLAARGHIVLRFDYRGQGQSLGRALDLDLEVMAADVGEALAWLEATASIERMALLGIGLGATAAAMTPSATGLPLAVWEPVPELDSLLHRLARAKLAVEMGFASDGGSYDGRSLADIVADDLARDEFERYGFFDAGGFEIGSPLRDSAREHNLLDALASSPRPLFLAAAADVAGLFAERGLEAGVH
ncbi:MAG: alpha/beta hydrolase family protein, partial [Acidimicrobiia bacterium]